jgi:hypothetical protein
MYNLYSFCGVSLMHYQNAPPIGSGETPTAYIPLVDGGALDAFGGTQKAPGVVERVKTCKLWADTQQELSDLYFALLALRGKRGPLMREMVNGDLQWMYARLVEVVAAKDPQPFAQDIELRFVTQDACWRGETLTTRGMARAWQLNTGLDLNAGLYFNGQMTASNPTVITITVGAVTDAGRAPVRAIKITATAGEDPLTALSLVRTGGETLSWAGTLVAGKSVIIDTGTLQVTNDGADAYDELTFAATADMAAWLTLQPGPNIFTVNRTGGGVGLSIIFEFYEAWY